jgi:ElaB/YqjD/DUF883 family membrane-anchored ribosome-binding protein
MNTDTTQLTQERLIGDLRLVIENAEQLLNNTNQYTSEIYQNARAKLTAALNCANEELARVEEAQLTRMIDATHAANVAYADQSGEARILRAFRQA